MLCQPSLHLSAGNYCHLVLIPIIIIYIIYREIGGHFILKSVAAITKNLSHQIELFFMDCKSSHLIPTDYSSFPGFVKHRESTNLNEVEDEIFKAQCKLTYLCDNIAIETARNNPNDHLSVLVKNVGSVFHEVVKTMLSVQINLYLERMSGETLETSLRLRYSRGSLWS